MSGTTAGRVELRVWRQDGPEAEPRFEHYLVTQTENTNVISALMEIQRDPRLSSGERAQTQIAWEANCLEEVCGACSMVINGVPRQACSTLLKDLDKPVVIEPLHKFPVVRDLMVDRSGMFEALKKVKAFIHIDGTHDLGPGPRMSPEAQQEAYPYSNCMSCGCCLEVCPQFNGRSGFIGAAAIGQVALFNLHPTGAMHKTERLHAVMGKGGVADCGNAQLCVEACPKDIPLTHAIARVGRDATVQWLKDLFVKD
ncbi:MAG: succinate dehydrogenase iron-sulfur subunit [Myxococcales bacterium]